MTFDAGLIEICHQSFNTNQINHVQMLMLITIQYPNKSSEFETKAFKEYEIDVSILLKNI